MAAERDAAQDAVRLSARLILHIVPRARATAVAGRHGDALKIRVAAPPVEDAANQELIRFLATRLRVPRSAITITAGAASRLKIVAVVGIESEAALRVLEGE